MKIAILDLGTNTFNLLIAENSGLQTNFLLEKRIPVKVGHGGFETNKITAEAYDRGLKAIDELVDLTGKYECDRIIATATSMFRDAANAGAFREEVKKKYGITIEIISGEREAELIWKGVNSAIREQSLKNIHSAVSVSTAVSDSGHIAFDEKFLIMDIGGGSTEFIIGDRSAIHWKKSYQLGVTRLFEKFRPSDPISESEIREFEEMLSKELSDLFVKINENNIKKLIGSAGSFESFCAMISYRETGENYDPSQVLSVIPVASFHSLANELGVSDRSRRKNMKGLIAIRRDLIVLSALFTRFVLTRGGLDALYLSAYSLKEGLLAEQFPEKKN